MRNARVQFKPSDMTENGAGMQCIPAPSYGVVLRDW